MEWVHDASAEKAAPEHFVELALARLDAHPAFHLYHFGAYEPSALTRLMGRYGTREEGVDRLLRAGVFVDLYTVTRQSVVISRESCSLKDFELLYREGAVAQAMDSVVAYHRWQLEQNPETLADIAAYHAEDCRPPGSSATGLKSSEKKWSAKRALCRARSSEPASRRPAYAPPITPDCNSATGS